jgi:hypothetical protein
VITRRRLLQAFALSATAITTLAFRHRHAGSPEPYETGPPAFPYLKVRAGTVEAFEADYQQFVGRGLPRDQWPDPVQAQFLLSTDFFRFDADEARVVSYVGFYDPTITPSNNPLARFD